MTTPIRVLFLCTGNSCRSQMAEGFARSLRADVIAASSAGIERHGMNPFTIKSMAAAGVDISDQWSKTLDDLGDATFDYVVTLCGHAHETCPRFPGDATVLHHGFDDPVSLVKGVTDEEEALAHYNRVRDEIRAFVEAMPHNLPPRKHPADIGFSV